MVFLPNLGVNLRPCLCGVVNYASAQALDFLDLGQKSAFLNWKQQQVPIFGKGHLWMGTSYFTKIFDEKNMPVMMKYFIGRWSSVVNVKNSERRATMKSRNAQEKRCPALPHSIAMLYFR